MRRVWIFVVGSCVAAACAGSGSGADPIDGPGAAVGQPDAGVVGEAPPSTRATPASTTVVPVPADSSPDLIAEPSPVEDPPDDRPPAPVDDDGGGPIDLGTDDDPSFELGPDIVLDVDVARFPVDDAGVGGAGPGPGVTNDVAAPASPTGWAGFDDALEAALIRPGNTAASVAVSIGGDVVHEQAFGLRDPQSGDPAEPQDRFRIASISKTITAITVMQLVEDGVIGLDDPVGQLVADHIGAGPVGASGSLTFRQLLSPPNGFRQVPVDLLPRRCRRLCRRGPGRAAQRRLGRRVRLQQHELLRGRAGDRGDHRAHLRAGRVSLVVDAARHFGDATRTDRRPRTRRDPARDDTAGGTTWRRWEQRARGLRRLCELVTILDSLDASTPGFKPLEPETVLQMIAPVGGQLGQRGYGYGVISYGGNRFGHTGTIESTHAMLLNRGDGVTWAVTVAGQSPSESTDLERIVNAAFAAGGFVAG